MAKKRTRGNVKSRLAGSQSRKPNLTLAAVALILNVLFPGVGSLVGGKIKAGIWQIVLTSLALIIYSFSDFSLVGFLVYVAALIWGINTGISLIKKAQ